MKSNGTGVRSGRAGVAGRMTGGGPGSRSGRAGVAGRMTGGGPGSRPGRAGVAGRMTGGGPGSRPGRAGVAGRMTGGGPGTRSGRAGVAGRMTGGGPGSRPGRAGYSDRMTGGGPGSRPGRAGVAGRMTGGGPGSRPGRAGVAGRMTGGGPGSRPGRAGYSDRMTGGGPGSRPGRAGYSDRMTGGGPGSRPGRAGYSDRMTGGGPGTRSGRAGYSDRMTGGGPGTRPGRAGYSDRMTGGGPGTRSGRAGYSDRMTGGGPGTRSGRAGYSDRMTGGGPGTRSGRAGYSDRMTGGGPGTRPGRAGVAGRMKRGMDGRSDDRGTREASSRRFSIVSDSVRTIRKLTEENKRFLNALSSSSILSASLRLDEVMLGLMKKAKVVCNAEASSLMLLDEETQQLSFHTLTVKDKEQADPLLSLRLNMGEGIAGWVAKNHEPVLIKDCTKDKRFYKNADKETKFKTSSMICVPLVIENRCLGVVQVLNRLDQQAFDEVDLHLFQFLANQAAIAIENARLYEMATVDKMTGLYRKDFFMSRMAEEFEKAKRLNTSLSLLMSDIDLFKDINDRYGHEGGDVALVAIAKLLNQTVRNKSKSYMAGRYGGEEFCVLMPGVDEQKAKKLGELIRKNVANQSIQIGESQAKITISVGISTYPLHKAHLKEAEDCIKIADKALYLCKAKGRNCVSVYEEDSNS